MQKLVEKYCEMPAGIRRPMWRVWHNLILKIDKNKDAVFMNYGYESLNGDAKISLQPEDEINRYCAQLYDFVVSKVEVENKDVLEVGSGRGGGASYITRYRKPKSYVAMDISENVIKFCNNYHNVEGLSFVTGVAEEPPFPNESFDIVVNVESARCYKSIKKFFEEVHRMLRPEGHFCFADMIKKGEYDEVKADLLASGFEIVNETNISQNVVKALDADHARRDGVIEKKAPKFLRKAFRQFAGTKGTERYESFANGKMEYWSFVLKKK
ncbi:MAG: class I SAM-dependent methyltransferase [Perlabentimonas sp.]